MANKEIEVNHDSVRLTFILRSRTRVLLIEMLPRTLVITLSHLGLFFCCLNFAGFVGFVLHFEVAVEPDYQKK